MYPINRMTIYLTRECNLRCRYCFIEHSPQSLAREVGERSLEWLIREASGSMPDLSVGFFGGEPLLAWDLLLGLIRYGAAEAGQAGKSIRFSMTTNGLLLTEERLDLLAPYPITLTVSIDGPEEVHDCFRVDRDGRGTFRRVMERIPLILDRFPGAGARITVNPETAAVLGASAGFVMDLGFRRISFGFNSDVKWSQTDMENLDRELRKVANRYLETIVNGASVRISVFNNSLNNLISGARPVSVCGAGKGFVNVNLQGDIYPCHHFACLDGFRGALRLGDVFTGMDADARLPFLRYDAAKSLGCYTPCDRCRARAICGGGCLAKGFERTGLFQMPDPIEQKFNMIVSEIAEQLHDVLKTRRPPAFEEWCRELGVECPCDD